MVKILFFPIRLVLFLIVASISGIILVFNRSVSILILISARLVRTIGICFFILFIAANVGAIAINIEEIKTINNDPVWAHGILICVSLVFIAILNFLPQLTDKIYVWLEVAQIWLWGAAKAIIFWDKSYLYM